MATPAPTLRKLLAQAGVEPVEFMDPETKSRFVLVRAELFQEMQAILADEERSLRDLDAWAKLARKARDQWAKENAY